MKPAGVHGHGPQMAVAGPECRCHACTPPPGQPIPSHMTMLLNLEYTLLILVCSRALQAKQVFSVNQRTER